MKLFRYGALFGAVIVLDRLTKVLFVRGAVWDAGIVHLALLENHGLVFSIPAPTWVSVLSMLVAMAVVLVWMVRSFRAQRWLTTVAMALMALGAASNVIDRVWYGFVIDFVSFGRWFPIFNLADLTIAVGLLLWLRDLTKRTPAA